MKGPHEVIRTDAPDNARQNKAIAASQWAKAREVRCGSGAVFDSVQL